MSQLKRNGVRRWQPSYLRNRGHLSKAQKMALRSLWPTYGIHLMHGKRIKMSDFFPKDQPTCLEIGFGMGEALLQRALMRPDRNFIGVEVHKPGIANVLKNIEANQCSNIRIVRSDALVLLYDHIWENSFHDVSIFFPDPWPKPKDQHRRILRSETLPIIEHTMQKTGLLYFATDVESYAHQVLKLLSETSSWKNQSTLFSSRPDWRPHTKYEQKAIVEGRFIWDLRFLFQKE